MLHRSSVFHLVVLTCCLAAHAGEPAIPFPAALDAAAVSVEKLDSILDDSLILGNGDINALLYSDGSNLVLRLTKNDVWDARLDAKLDPPIPTLKRIKELAAGEWKDRKWILPEGSTWKGPDSYHAHPYPCPRACGIVRFGSRPAKPAWRCVRAQGRHNAWERKGNVTVMSIAGAKGASNGYALGPLALATDGYPTLRVRLSGTENAQFYIDVMGEEGGVVFGSKWQETPTKSEQRNFKLPPGRRAARIILYTWTEDGKRAENRFESVTFGGLNGDLPVDLTLTAPPSCPARLDLRRAVAHVAGAADSVPKATARALARVNVFLVETTAAAQLLPNRGGDLPETEVGSRDGVQWLRQQIPGDDGWPGMSFAVALGSTSGRTAVAVVTSRESPDVVERAIDLASGVAMGDQASIIRDHEAEWARYWAASGVDIGDGLLRDAWYQNLYFLRCVSKRGAVAPGLFASLINDSPAWHGDYHTNYNIQQTFWTAYNTNHPDLAEPYDRLIASYFPRAEWLAREVFDCGGAYYPHVLFAYEPPPERCSSPTRRQYIHHVWGFTLGVAGFTVQPVWWHYKVEPDRDFLEKIAYPAVRDVATFYADFIDGCEAGEGGKVVLGPSVSPEHWGWTPKFARNRNCAFDIAMVRTTLAAAIEGAATLGRDAPLVARWKKALTLLPAYPTTKGEKPVVVDVEDAPPITYNIAVPATPVFPGDVVTWWSPPEEKALFTRTIAGCRWNGNNSMVILGVARARLSMPGTLGWLRTEVQARTRPNKTITLNRLGARFNNFGHYTEQFAVSMAVSELLLQSVADVLRVFPAWPKDKDARFQDLRAQGGFLVSAAASGGKVGPIAITSTVGGKLRLLSPWPSLRVARPGQPVSAHKPDARGIVELDTRRGERLVLSP